jgi:hypothetical protein
VRAARHLDFSFLLLALCLFAFLLGRLLVPRADQGSELRASRERRHARAGGRAQAGRSDQGHTARREEPVKKWPGLSVGATGLSLPLLLSLPFLPFAMPKKQLPSRSRSGPGRHAPHLSNLPFKSSLPSHQRRRCRGRCVAHPSIRPRSVRTPKLAARASMSGSCAARSSCAASRRRVRVLLRRVSQIEARIDRAGDKEHHNAQGLDGDCDGVFWVQYQQHPLPGAACTHRTRAVLAAASSCLHRAGFAACESTQTLRFYAVNGECTRPARRPVYLHLLLEPDAPRPALRCSEH